MESVFKALGRLAAFSAAALFTVSAQASDPGVEFFESKIRPILVDSCYKCHSANEGSKIKGGLSLDTKAGVLKGGDTGPAIVPGDVEKSLLIKAVRHASEELQMPPDKDKKLSAEQIASLEEWVKMGAPDPRGGGAVPTASAIQEEGQKHWAFKSVTKPSLPDVKNKAWVAESLDAFILAKLEEKKLTPSPKADKRTLIRRATFDLTGLPPTPEEVQEFIDDKSADAYPKLIERLLASQAYGERWARHWLDVARYSDSKGYVFEEERRYPYSYTYRDYVIRAFNEDLPYNQFVTEQIAADLLPLGEDKRSLAALGFLTLGRRFLNNQPDIIDDRIDVVTRGTLGLTVVCARCHDHKYDPISTKDYYSLYGVFASTSEPEDKPLLGEGSKPPEYEAFANEREKRVKEHDDFKALKFQETLAELRKRAGDYLLASHDTEKLEDKSKGENLARERKLEQSVVRKWSKKLEDARGKADPVLELWIQSAALTNDFKAEFAALAEKSKDAKEINPFVASTVFADPLPTSLKEVSERYNKVFTEVQASWDAAQKSAKEKQEELPKQHVDAGQEQIRQLVYGEGSLYNYSFEDIRRMLDVPSAQKVRALKRKIEELEATHPGAPPRAMALVDKSTPHNPRVFIRGNPNNAGPEVPRQFLELLEGADRKPFEKGSGRLEMAQKIVDPKNPLTARVMVNRVWLHHFGVGLVRTPSDFGLRSDPPTHPELLDFLATTFVEQGWSVKKLHRHIMLSNTYQQSAEEDSKKAEIDPMNDMLWRMNRRRLEFEAMRDSLLVTAGKLDLRAGGQGVEIAEAHAKPRRTIYGIVERQNLPGLFRTFDFASPDSTSPQRFSTTVPQQALFMLNSPFIIEQAREIVTRPEIKAQPTTEAKVKALYQIAFQRPPAKDEMKLALAFLKDKTHEPAGTRDPVWLYGYGAYDTNSQRVVDFKKLPHYTGESWQGGRDLPHKELGWVALNARGGHPGGKQELSAIRRWTAPEALTLSLRGEVVHESKEGDGIRARLVSSRQGLLGEWTVKDGKKGARLETLEVTKGETIDFVVDCIESENSDSFRWEPVLEKKDETGAVVAKWSGRGEFTGNQDSWRTLDPWEKYAQALLVSNEMMFVD